MVLFRNGRQLSLCLVDVEWVGGKEIIEKDPPWSFLFSRSLPPSLDVICGNQIPAGTAAEGNRMVRYEAPL